MVHCSRLIRIDYGSWADEMEDMPLTCKSQALYIDGSFIANGLATVQQVSLFCSFHSFSHYSGLWNFKSNILQSQSPEPHMEVTVAPSALLQPDMVTVLAVRNGFSNF